MSEIEGKLNEGLNSPGRQIDFYEALAEAQSALGEGVVVYDGHTRRFLYVNNAVCKLFGYSKEEMFEMRSVLQVISPEHRSLIMSRISMRLSNIEQGEVQQMIGITKDGRRFPVEYSTKRIEGEETKFVGLLRDVSNRGREESAVPWNFGVEIENRPAFTESAAIIPSAVGRANTFLILNSEKKISLMGPVEIGFGLKSAEWINRSFSELVHPDDLRFISQMLNRVLEGKASPVFSARLRSGENEYASVELTLQPFSLEVTASRGVAVLIRLLESDPPPASS